MRFLYEVFIRVYYLAIWLVSFFNAKAKQWITGRYKQKLNARDNKKDFVIWMHCSSLGEFEQGKPVAERLLQEIKNSVLVLSFFSPSGYAATKNYKYAEAVYYLPLDTKNKARNWIMKVKPSLALFIKYDLWPNYVFQLRKQQIPTVLINGSFRKDQIYFNPIVGGLFRQMLKSISLITVQQEHSKNLLNKVGVSSQISGDTRFDRVSDLANQNFEDQTISTFLNDAKKVLILGSTYPVEHEIIQELVEKSHFEKVIIAPHQIDNASFESLNSVLKEYCTYTGFGQSDYTKKVMILDTIGILSRAYRFASVAYVGGGLGNGLHNSLEAAVYGIPVVVGTNHHKFPEVNEFIADYGYIQVNSAKELVGTLSELSTDNERIKTLGERNSKFVNQNKGSVTKNVELIQGLIQ